MAVGGIEKSLISLHAIAAAMTSTPEFALEPAEAAMLAHSIAEVNRHYKMPGLKPEHVAIGALIGTCVTVYGGKFRDIANRKSGKAPATKSQPVQDAPTVSSNPPPIPGGSWFPDLNSTMPN